jgi:hypothetical protein
MPVIKKIVALKDNFFLQITIALIAATFLLLLYFFNYPGEKSFFPKCILHELTGLHCPGCGSQRAVYALLHGKILLAMHNNILLVSSIPLVIYSAFAFVWNHFHLNKIRQDFFYSSVFLKIVLVIVILFTVLRNIPRPPFTLLAPVL